MGVKIYVAVFLVFLIVSTIGGVPLDYPIFTRLLPLSESARLSIEKVVRPREIPESSSLPLSQSGRK